MMPNLRLPLPGNRDKYIKNWSFKATPVLLLVNSWWNCACWRVRRIVWLAKNVFLVMNCMRALSTFRFTLDTMTDVFVVLRRLHAVCAEVVCGLGQLLFTSLNRSAMYVLLYIYIHLYVEHWNVLQYFSVRGVFCSACSVGESNLGLILVFSSAQKAK